MIVPVSLSPEEVDRLRLEMAKAQLWEWNQLEEVKSRAVMRYRRYLGSWLVMCLAAFSAYVSYPGVPDLPIPLAALDLPLVARRLHGAARPSARRSRCETLFGRTGLICKERLQESDEAPQP